MKVKAGGLRLTDDVPGLLHAWARVADGSWFGLVEMVLWTKQAELHLTQHSAARHNEGLAWSGSP